MSKKRAAAVIKPGDFLLDVHTEPLPARFVEPALRQLKERFERGLQGKLAFKSITVYGTLRHLVVAVSGLEGRSADSEEKVKGPKEQAWKTPDGKYTPAAEGFARKHGLSVDKLVPENGVLYATVVSKGKPAVQILEELVVEALKSLEFPKSMVWEETGFRFGRPIRAITAMCRNTVIPVKIAGVKAGDKVYGHPATGKAAVVLKEPSKHAALLRQGLVIADPAERREYLLKALAQAAKPAGGVPDADEALIDETVFMVEHPVPVLGRLRDEHMRLPAALLKTTMKKQLKFFPVLAKDGALLPAFIGVRDGLSSGNELVAEGYKRVLEARFNDAAFFFGRDGAAPLASKLPLLERVTYQKALGSMAQKAARVEAIAEALAEALRSTAPVDERVVRTAARLVYADLVTEVVKEFPELQGAMGGVYARRDGLDEGVALAIEQFYYPAAARGPVPATPEAALVSLAGKLDSLAGCFAAGLAPTGSADPYALRRQALGVVRIVLEKQLPLDLEDALARAVSLQPVAVPEPAKLSAQLGEFVWGRAHSMWEEMSFAVDEIRSVRAGALKDLVGAFRRLAAVRSVRREPSFEPLAAAFKRASNLLKQAGASNGEPPERKLLQEDAELALYDALVAAEGAANDRIVRGDFEGGLKSLVAVKPHLDLFFDKVMVMVDDPSVKRQRLALLSKLVRAFKRVADLAEIQSPGQ